MIDRKAVFLKTVVRILASFDAEDELDSVGYFFSFRGGWDVDRILSFVIFGRRTGFCIEGCRIWIVGSKQLDMVTAL
jgi:hypothetical protein